MFDRTTRLFLRYRDRGDAAALAAVFDRTAPELLRLALHLCRDLGDAEDLLQATFLAAIESAPRFERGKKVMPWLTGILVNRAHGERRRRRRADDAADEPDSLPGPTQQPHELAAGRELGARARTALDTLDEPFRQVLLLRFVHGMEPAEIALLLRRSPGTVRGQLHRGLQRLRGKLPTAVATALAATVVCTGRGLAAVRAAVLAEGARSAVATAAAGTAVLTTTLAMKKLLFTALALACTIALGVWAWPDAPGAPTPDEARESAVAQTGTATRPPGTPDAALAATTAAASVTERTTAPLPDDATAWPIAIVVVDGTTGTPLADTSVELHGPRTMTLLELQREFGDAAPAGWTGVPTGGPELRALRDLPAEVVAGGEARALLVPPTDGASPLLRGTTNAEGRCETRAPASGTFVVVRHEGYGVGRLLLDEQPTDDLRIALWPARVFAGVVRTVEGDIPPVPLRLRLCDDLQAWYAQTDAQGRFRAEVSAESIEVQCATPGWTTARDYRKPDSKVPWIGKRQFRVGEEVLVHVAPYGATWLHVTDAATGQPIELFQLIATDTSGYPRRCGQFLAPGGRLALDAPGEAQSVLDQPEMASYRTMRAATLTVFAQGHAPRTLRDVPLVGDAPKTIEVALERGALDAFAGQVTRGGETVPGARVQLRPLPPLQWDAGERMVLATQRCDERGAFALAAPPGEYVCEVFADDRCELQQQVTVPTPGAVTLDLGACVWVDVVVVDANGKPVANHNAMVGAGIGQRGIGRTGSDGHVVFGPFPPGPLRARAPQEATEYSWTAAVEVEFAAAAGERPTITLQLGSVERVRPVLAFDGPAPAGGFAGFTARNSYGKNMDPVPVGEGGEVPIPLLPGKERLIVDAPGGRSWTFPLPDGARDGHVLQLRWSGLAYVGTAVDEAGAPIAGCQIEAWPTQPGPTVRVQTAADGSFRLDGLEPCIYRLSIPDRPKRSQRALFPRQFWLAQAPPALDPPRLGLTLHRADGDLLRGLSEQQLIGRVVDAAGNPVGECIAGVSTLIPQDGGVLEVAPRPAWVRTDTAGGFTLQVVRGGAHCAQFSRKIGEMPTRQDVALPPQDEVHHEFVLR